MSKEFIDALNLLAAERNLDREQLLLSFEEALEQAFERNAELTDRRQPKIGLPDDGSPRAGL